jgi:hypothetical protein
MCVLEVQSELKALWLKYEKLLRQGEDPADTLGMRTSHSSAIVYLIGACFDHVSAQVTLCRCHVFH